MTPARCFSYVLVWFYFCSILVQARPTSIRSADCPVLLPEDQPARQARHDGLGAPPFLQTFHSLENSSVSPRIINGDPAAEGIVPYMVAIMTSKTDLFYSSICTGALIAPTWVLTAAHCLEEDVFYAALVGIRSAAEYTQFPNNFVRVVDFKVHDQYDNSVVGHPNDLMLLRLENEVPNSKTMKILDNPSRPEERTVARVAGYGDTKPVGPDGAVNRQVLQVDIPIASMSVCRDAYKKTRPPTTVDPVKHLCAGYVAESGEGSRKLCGSCQGDSGGALFQYDASGEPVVVGVVSAGESTCGSDEIPTLYVRISAHIEWLEEMVPDIKRASSTNKVFVSGTSAGTIIGAIIGGLLAVVFVVAAIIFFKWRSSTGAARPTQMPYTSEQPLVVQPAVVQPSMPVYSADSHSSFPPSQQGLVYTPDGYAYAPSFTQSPTAPGIYVPQQPYQSPDVPSFYPYPNADLEPAQNPPPLHMPYTPHPDAESKPPQYSVPSYATDVSAGVQQSSSQPSDSATFPQEAPPVAYNTPDQDTHPLYQIADSAPAPSSPTEPAPGVRNEQDGEGIGTRDETVTNMGVDHDKTGLAPEADEDSTRKS